MNAREWVPVLVAMAAIATGLTLADSGRQSAALIVLGAGVLSAGIAIGYWLRSRD